MLSVIFSPLIEVFQNFLTLLIRNQAHQRMLFFSYHSFLPQEKRIYFQSQKIFLCLMVCRLLSSIFFHSYALVPIYIVIIFFRILVLLYIHFPACFGVK